MKDRNETLKQALKENFRSYLKPSSYKVNHRLKDVRDLKGLGYDLFILDRDCTLQGYHSNKRVPKFEEALEYISFRSEIVSNSSYDELLRIRDLFGYLMPISKLVKFEGFDRPFLLRFVDGELNVLTKTRSGVVDVTPIMSQGDSLFNPISYNFKKPNPEVIRAVIEANKTIKRIPNDPKVLMVGDRYFTDIVAGNLAEVDTAKVRPYKPLTDKLDLILARYLFDYPIGSVMSRL